MNAPPGFGGQAPVAPMSARFEFQPGISPVPDHAGNDRGTPRSRFVGRQHFDLPGGCARQNAVHPEQVGGKQRRFIAAVPARTFETGCVRRWGRGNINVCNCNPAGQALAPFICLPAGTACPDRTISCAVCKSRSHCRYASITRPRGDFTCSRPNLRNRSMSVSFLAGEQAG